MRFDVPLPAPREQLRRGPFAPAYRGDTPAGGQAVDGVPEAVRLASGAQRGRCGGAAGQTVPWLRRLDLLAPRRLDLGPQSLPVNRTAAYEAELSIACVEAARVTG